MPQQPPLGRAFTKPAEMLGEFAVAKPVRHVDEVCFTITGRHNFVSKATVRLPDGTIVDGFAKSANPDTAGKQVMIGQLATLMGAPLAPYLLVCGDAGLSYVNRSRGHESDCTLFSPRLFDNLFTWENELDANGRPWQDLTPADSLSLGAAGQFRAWVCNPSYYASNLLRDTDTGAVGLIDHELYDPARSGLDEQSHAFIMEGWKTRQSTVARSAYLKGAKGMAARIQDVSAADLRQLASHDRDAGLFIDSSFVNGLLERGPLFADFVGLPRPYAPLPVTPVSRGPRFG